MELQFAAHAAVTTSARISGTPGGNTADAAGGTVEDGDGGYSRIDKVGVVKNWDPVDLLLHRFPK